MNITEIAIDRARITFTVIIVLIIAEFMAFRTIPRAEDPGFIIRTAMIMTYFPGASPERVEMLVTDKLEKAIQEMPELDFEVSQSKSGVSLIFVNTKENLTEMRPIWDRLRRKVDAVKSELPEGIIGPIVNDEFGDIFGTIVTLTGEGYSYSELKEIADQVRDELLLIDEVAKVELYGDQEGRIFVDYNNARLGETGLSPVQLKTILESANIIIPGGNFSTDHERIVLEPSGNFESIEQLKQSIIQIPGRRDMFHLEDLAEVYRGYIDPPASVMKSSGENALALAVSLRDGGNIIFLGEAVRNKISELQQVYPLGVEFDFVSFQPDVVDKKVNDFTTSLLQAMGVVLLVMLVTIGMRTGLTVASLIPVTMLISIFVMSQFGLGLNQMTLASLIISLGMLVDNAIVMTESIMVMMNSGMKARDAAIESARELRIPLLTSSLTTCAAFLPIYLAESTTGEYVAPLFVVVTITLMCSWLLSLTMIPMLCTKSLKPNMNSTGEKYDSRLFRFYKQSLLQLLRHRIITIIGIFIIFIIAMQGFALIPNIFFPAKDQNQFIASLTLPIGTSIERTELVAQRLEDFVESELKINEERVEGVTNWVTFIGESPPRFYLSYNPVFASPELNIMILNTTSYDIIPELIQKMEQFCIDNFPDLKTDIESLTNGPPVTAPVEIRISGKDPDTIFNIADYVKAQLTQISGTKNIDDDWGMRTKKLTVEVNQARARRAGLSNQDVAVSLQTILSGFQTTQYREDDKLIPVTLRAVAEDRQDIENLESLNIYSLATGNSVPLMQVADTKIVWQPSKILRRNRLKTVTISSELEPGYTAIEIVNAIDPWLQQESSTWNVGYSYEYGGEIESSEKAQASIGAKMPVGFLIIILLLVAQFNSFRRSVIVLLTIPLGLIGVVIGLLALDGVMGFMTFLGVVSLSGIVINNAIVLLERIKLEIEDNGLTSQDAILEAAQKRLRPILLTTATTIGGLFPLYLGGGPMWESMAIAIMSGLFFATVLTLGIVPVLYSLIFNVSFKNVPGKN